MAMAGFAGLDPAHNPPGGEAIWQSPLIEAHFLVKRLKQRLFL
jgi:hypothetical protein